MHFNPRPTGGLNTPLKFFFAIAKNGGAALPVFIAVRTTVLQLP